MIVYRTCHKDYLKLDGEGSKLYGGRWNSKGVAVVYTSESLELSLSESTVQSSKMKTLMIEIKDEAKIKEYTIEQLRNISKNWKTEQSITKLLGNKFVVEGKYLLLKVPSVKNPNQFNFIINCNQEDFDSFVKISSTL